MRYVAPYRQSIRVDGVIHWPGGREVPTYQSVEFCQGPGCDVSTLTHDGYEQWIHFKADDYGLHIVMEADAGPVRCAQLDFRFHSPTCVSRWAARIRLLDAVGSPVADSQHGGRA